MAILLPIASELVVLAYGGGSFEAGGSVPSVPAVPSDASDASDPSDASEASNAFSTQPSNQSQSCEYGVGLFGGMPGRQRGWVRWWFISYDLCLVGIM